MGFIGIKMMIQLIQLSEKALFNFAYETSTIHPARTSTIRRVSFMLNPGG